MKSTTNMFFSSMFECIDVVHFVMQLIIMKRHMKCNYLYNIQIYICINSIYECIFNP
jgi:hypothetical protein